MVRRAEAQRAGEEKAPARVAVEAPVVEASVAAGLVAAVRVPVCRGGKVVTWAASRAAEGRVAVESAAEATATWKPCRQHWSTPLLTVHLDAN